jgi:Nif11 domain
MSKAHARKFIKLLHTDPKLRKAVQDSSDKFVKLAKEKNLKVTPEEVRAALHEHLLENMGTHDDGTDCLNPFSEVPGF